MLNRSEFIIFTCGVVVGGGLTWLFLKKELEAMAEEEIQEMKKYYEKRFTNEEVGVIKRAVAEECRPNPKDITVVKPKSKPPLAEVISSKDRVKYDQVVSDTGYSEEEEHPKDDHPEEPFYDDEEKFKSMRKYKDPYVISPEEYLDDPEFEKITLGYYAIDDTLADENEDIIVDVDMVIGGDSLTMFGEESDDKDIVFVRNERLGIDYEVVRMYLSYKESVMGMFDDDE